MNNVRSNLLVPNMAKKPQRLPTTRKEFEALGYSERVWMYQNRRFDYDRFTKPVKPWEA